MTKYHISNGEPKPCKAQHNCPLGGDVEHFEGSKKDALQWAEHKNSQDAGGAFQGNKTRTDNKEIVDKKRELQELLNVITQRDPDGYSREAYENDVYKRGLRTNRITGRSNLVKGDSFQTSERSQEWTALEDGYYNVETGEYIVKAQNNNGQVRTMKYKDNNLADFGRSYKRTSSVVFYTGNKKKQEYFDKKTRAEQDFERKKLELETGEKTYGSQEEVGVELSKFSEEIVNDDVKSTISVFEVERKQNDFIWNSKSIIDNKGYLTEKEFGSIRKDFSDQIKEIHQERTADQERVLIYQSLKAKIDKLPDSIVNDNEKIKGVRKILVDTAIDNSLSKEKYELYDNEKDYIKRRLHEGIELQNEIHDNYSPRERLNSSIIIATYKPTEMANNQESFNLRRWEDNSVSNGYIRKQVDNGKVIEDKNSNDVIHRYQDQIKSVNLGKEKHVVGGFSEYESRINRVIGGVVSDIANTEKTPLSSNEKEAIRQKVTEHYESNRSTNRMGRKDRYGKPVDTGDPDQMKKSIAYAKDAYNDYIANNLDLTANNRDTILAPSRVKKIDWDSKQGKEIWNKADDSTRDRIAAGVLGKSSSEIKEARLMSAIDGKDIEDLSFKDTKKAVEGINRQ